MTRVVHNGMITIAMECFKGGFVDLHGKLVIDDYRVRGPVFCMECGTREATCEEVVRMSNDCFHSGYLTLCKRFFCNFCRQVDKPKCRCGKPPVRVVICHERTDDRWLTAADVLCGSCKFDKLANVIETSEALVKGSPQELTVEYSFGVRLRCRKL